MSVIRIDLRGIACPMNFVQAKFELSKIARDDLLELILDDGGPIKNVPRSLKSEGHDVSTPIAYDDDSWIITVKKNKTKF